jgi:hypothetical protein
MTALICRIDYGYCNKLIEGSTRAGFVKNPAIIGSLMSAFGISGSISIVLIKSGMGMVRLRQLLSVPAETKHFKYFSRALYKGRSNCIFSSIRACLTILCNFDVGQCEWNNLADGPSISDCLEVVKNFPT